MAGSANTVTAISSEAVDAQFWALVCEDEAVETVVVDEACDDSDEDELERCALFRGMNILKSSLAAPLGWLLHRWNTGWATAVITVKVRRLLPEQTDAGAGVGEPSPSLHTSPRLLCGGCSLSLSHERSAGGHPQHDSRRQNGGGDSGNGTVRVCSGTHGLCEGLWGRDRWCALLGRVVCFSGGVGEGARATLLSSSLSGQGGIETGASRAGVGSAGSGWPCAVGEMHGNDVFEKRMK